MKVNLQKWSAAILIGLLCASGAMAQEITPGHIAEESRRDEVKKWWKHDFYQVFADTLYRNLGKTDWDDLTEFLDGSGGSYESIDTVTLGSRMAYSVGQQEEITEAIQTGSLLPSLFKWGITRDASQSLKTNMVDVPIDTGFVKKKGNALAGGTLARLYSANRAVNLGGEAYGPYVGEDSTYYHNVKRVSITFIATADSANATVRNKYKKWNDIVPVYANGEGDTAVTRATLAGLPAFAGDITAGAKKFISADEKLYLHVGEKLVDASGRPMCATDNPGEGVDGDSIVPIQIVDVPFLQWKAGSKQGAVTCGTTDSLTVGCAFKGYPPYTVEYRIVPWAEKAVKPDLTGGNVYVAVFNSDNVMTLPGKDFTGSPDAVRKYSVVFTNVTDRFSRKSLDPVQGKIYTGDIDGGGINDDEVTVNVIDAPRTKDLKHIKNVRYRQ